MRSKTAARHYAIGSAVRCSDGDCGRLERVIIEPIGRTLTHLLVQPPQRHRPSRLVPAEALETAERADIDIVLTCSLAEFEAFEPARLAQFLQGASGQWSYEQDQMLSWPYYRLGLRAGSAEYAGMPLEDVHVRRGEHLYATDGALGRVQGLIVDRDDRRVTHVLLDEGHIWGQKRAAIPVNALLADGGARINLTRREVRDLPPVEIDVEE